jgi:ABC-type multidrug transport system fused ATPase/permease subunit
MIRTHHIKGDKTLNTAMDTGPEIEWSARPNARRGRLRRVLGKSLFKMRRDLALAVAGMLGFTAADLLGPWPLKVIIDHVLLQKPVPDSLAWLRPVIQSGPVSAVVVLSLSILAIAVVRGAFAYVQLFLTSRIGHKIVYTLRRKLFVHLQQLSLAFHTEARSGELLNKLTNDTNQLRDVFSEWALTFAAQLLTVLGMIGVMAVLNWQLALVVLMSIPVLGAALFQLFGRVKASSRKQRTREGEIAARIGERLGAIALVQAFGRERYEREQFSAVNAETLSESIHTSRLEAGAARMTEIASAIGICAVVLFGSLQVLNGALLPGDLLVFVTYMMSMYKPLRSLAKLSTKFSKALVSAERIGEILDTRPDIEDTPGAVLAPRLRAEITFDRVSHVYRDGRPVLKDVSFVIRPGERVALVGASGAGKSTIVSLLLRFYDPNAGTIRVDGLDLREYQRAALRQQMGVVLQEPMLFATSIRENIAYGKPDATPAEIERAARMAHAHDFITALPAGYDTLVGERGSTLSGGQRQRISLARALVKEPSILILDEPTAAIDAESAALVMDSVTRLQSHRTVLVVTHQLTRLAEFDRILVMRHGELIEQGSFGELVDAGGYFSELLGFQLRVDVAASARSGLVIARAVA